MSLTQRLGLTQTEHPDVPLVTLPGEIAETDHSHQQPRHGPGDVGGVGDGLGRLAQHCDVDKVRSGREVCLSPAVW